MSALDALARVRQQPALMALADLPIWCVSGGTLENGKPDKSPKNPRQPWKHAQSNNPATWGTLEQVESAARRYPNLVQHFGIVSGTHARVLDWDYKPHTEQPLSVATQATLFAHCYQETSLSGRGLRCLFLADGLDFKKQKFDIEDGVELEVFASHQYAILTGHCTNPAPVQEAGSELVNLLGVLKPQQVARQLPRPQSPMPQGQGQQGQTPWDAAAQSWSLHDLLTRYGYPRKSEGRYLSPTSQSGLAGVTTYTDERGRERCYSHHANDPLNNGHANDVFDVYALLEHGGDYKAAAREARNLLGLNPVRAPEVYPYTLDQARTLWDEHGSDVLGQAGDYLTACNLHHHAREALLNLTLTIYHLAGEGNLRGSRAPYSLDVGSIKGLAALVGGRPGDCKPRLEWLAAHGLIGALRRVDPADPRSGLVIDLPADPRDLRFLGLTPDPLTPTTRPQTKNARHAQKPANTTLSAPWSNTSTANAKGNIDSPVQKNPLRALLRMALQVARNPGQSIEQLGRALGMRLQTARKQYAQLMELGYLTLSGRLTCTIDQFLRDLRAWGAEAARTRLIVTLQKQRDYAAHKAALCAFGVEKGHQKRYEQMRDRCEAQLERLADGEAPYAVLGRAA